MQGVNWRKIFSKAARWPDSIIAKIPVERGIGLAALVAAPFVAGYSAGYAVKAWQKGGKILPQLPVLETGIAALGGIALTLLLGYVALSTADSDTAVAEQAQDDDGAHCRAEFQSGS